MRQARIPVTPARGESAPMKHRGLSLGVLIACGSTLVPAAAMDRSTELVARAFALTPDSNRGREIYARSCAGCHGREAWGRADTAIPALAGQRELYLIRQLADVAEVERDVREMHRLPVVVGASVEQQWRDVAAWLAARPLNPSPQHGDGRSLDLGSGLYRDTCAQCHGGQAEGDDAIAAPAMAGQHYSYLLMQIRGMASGHRSANIDFGLALMLDSFDATDMAAVADYISRLPAAPL